MSADGGLGQTGDAALVVEGLTVRYGGVVALDGVSLTVPRGELVAVIGANGAGKSSLVNAVVGIVPKSGGRVLHEADDVTDHTPERMVGRGVVLVPERRELFAALSVADNLLLGAYGRYVRGERDQRRALEHVYETFPQLAERRRQLAGTMSGGEQQMLVMARALMIRPRLMLIDEPSLGLAPQITSQIFGIIRSLTSEMGITVLLIEQNVKKGLEVADWAFVLDLGTCRFEGPADEIVDDPRIRDLYLGQLADAAKDTEETK